MDRGEREIAERIRKLLVQHDRLKKELEARNMTDLAHSEDVIIGILRGIGLDVVKKRFSARQEHNGMGQRREHEDNEPELRREVDPSTQLLVQIELKDHRRDSDERYAIKLVERIVFGAIALIAVAVLSALLGLVIKKAMS